MGYSYVETFVYTQGSFYGCSRTEFKDLVEKNGMRFLGSMTFFNPLNKTEKEIKKWWKKTISDHLEAGVKYLSTSNNALQNIKSLEELNNIPQESSATETVLSPDSLIVYEEF